MFWAQLFKLLWKLPVISGIQQEKADKSVFFKVFLNCAKNIQTPACSFKLDKWFWSSSKKNIREIVCMTLNWFWFSDSLLFHEGILWWIKKTKHFPVLFFHYWKAGTWRMFRCSWSNGAIHYNNDNTQRLSPPDSRPIHPYKMDHREPLEKLKQNRYLRGWKQRKASKKEYRKIL